MADLFEKIVNRRTPLGQFQDFAHGYFSFPELEGEIGPEMYFHGKKVIVWSVNSYLGLANHPEIRKADAEAAKQWGLAYPMGSRMMTGETKYHRQLEQDLAEFVGKETGYLLNYGYQGMVSIIDALLDRHDVVVLDSEAHACIYDGSRLHFGRRLTFEHNNMESLAKQLETATNIVSRTGGGILVVTEGVFGMAGDLGKLDKIVELKNKYQFRLLVDDAHGFGTMGKTGAGTGEHLGAQDGVDVYFATFAKSMAAIGAFVASDKQIIRYLRYTMRSQIFAKSLPMPIVIGAIKRLELLKTRPELREKLWTIANALQNGLRKDGFDLGRTESAVTPVHLKGNPYEAAALIADLRENYGIFCSGVLYPVVPKGVVMLRLIPTAAHELKHVEKTIEAFKDIREKLEKGYYRFDDPMEILRKYHIHIEL